MSLSKLFFSSLGIATVAYGIIYSTILLMIDCDLELFLLTKFGKFLLQEDMKNCRGLRQHIDISRGQLKDKDVLVMHMDVLDFESHKNVFNQAVAHFGCVDILINNAGRSQRAKWEKIEISVDMEMFNLNVFAPVNLTRVALEHFKETGGGQIAIVSSIAGLFPVPYSASYTGAKHAVQGYFKSLHIEKMQDNIHVTVLCPGPTFTNFLAESFTETHGQKFNGSVQPKDRRMTAERCGYLNAVALANKTKESWMAVFPVIPLTYISVYFPTLFRLGLKIFGNKRLFNLRDSKNTEIAFNLYVVAGYLSKLMGYGDVGSGVVMVSSFFYVSYIQNTGAQGN
ncbi:hypothetical protein NQ317_002761 [Molorchus minor]|uniref:Dehydrogenase/reductase SDR family member 7 n=1 Tax=Molorchus minor TaxID=1323400 RepID=A0ABQ9J5Z6_9CUCU|nr:hypothetical protein NQ317_002761 [Molorchus minor]